MSRTLVLFLLAGENVRAQYEGAIRRLALDGVDLVLALPGAGSAVNERFVLNSPGPGSRLERLARRMGALPLEQYDHIVLGGFSAGSGGVRVTLEEAASVNQVDGVFLIDSAHDAYGFLRFDWLEDFGRRALAGEKVLHLGHTDVRTYTYASTTQVADELCRRLELEPPAKNEAIEHAGLRVEDHDHKASDKSEHVHAFIGWGDELMAGAIAKTRELVPVRADREPMTEPERTSFGDSGAKVKARQLFLRERGYYLATIDGKHGPIMEAAEDAYALALRIARPLVLEMNQFDAFTLAERGLAWQGFEFGIGVKELPGSRHDPRILSYSKHCRRGGIYYGLGPDGRDLWTGTHHSVALPRDEDAWCAAYASASLRGSLKPGEPPPHGLRVSVREIVEDLRRRNRFHPKGSDYQPKPGDRAIWGRIVNGRVEDPTRGQRGHINTAVVFLDGVKRFTAIGGNEGNRVRLAEHSTDDVLFRGWGEI